MHGSVGGLHEGVDGVHGDECGMDGMSDGANGLDHDTISAPNSVAEGGFSGPLHPPSLKPEYSDVGPSPYGSATGSSPFSPQSSAFSG